MVGDGEIRDLGFSEPFHLYVSGIVGADGHAGVDNVGDDQHNLPDLFGQLNFLLLQGGQSIGVRLHFGLELLGLRQLRGILLGLTHKHTNLFALGIPGGAQILGGLDGLPVFLVQGDDLVHQRQFGLLELLFDILFDDFRIVPNKLNVQHNDSPHKR